jgi:G3E family GTPase
MTNFLETHVTCVTRVTGKIRPIMLDSTFLGAKLRAPALADTAVLVNEFGEIGLDHHLLRRVDGDIVLLQSGCLCCTIRGDLGAAIRDLHSRRERGEIPFFRRLVIETTGLADPVPILATIMAEPVIRHHFRVGPVIATVDAVNGALHLDRQPESVKQTALADRILVTKTDLAPPGAVAALQRRLERINPAAPILNSAPELPLDPEYVLAADLADPAAKGAEVERWLATDAAVAHGHGHRHDVNRHDAAIHAFCLRFERPLDWSAFGIWLSMLLHCRGADVLRIKGILNVAGSDRPVVVHGVQHLVHPPVHLERWPDEDRASRLVFIVRDLDRAVIERSLAAFNRLANPSETLSPPAPAP